MSEILQKNEVSIKFKEKSTFFILNFANIPIMTYIGGFLLIYYTDVVFLEPDKIGTIFLITRVLDGFTDPFMGYIIDHLKKTKWGRFRRALMIGSIICTVNYVFLWLAPAYFPNGKYWAIFISYICLGFTFDWMDIPLNSLIPVMSRTGNTRNMLAFIKSVALLSGTVFFVVIAVPIISAFSSPLLGYTFLIIVTSMFVFLGTFFGTFGIKERIEPISEERYKFKDLFKVLGSKPVFIHFISALLSSVSGGMGSAAALYFYTYVIGNAEIIGILTIFQVVGGLLGFVIGRPILKKFGKKYTYVLGALVSGLLSLCVIFVNPSNLIPLYLLYMGSAIGTGISALVGYGLQADNTDYIEWKYSLRTEGAIASLISFVNKSGMGVGAAMTGYILAISGYVANQSQNITAINGIKWAFVILPNLMVLTGALLMLFFYPLIKSKNEQIALELIERRKTE